jgi:hypothetical protein
MTRSRVAGPATDAAGPLAAGVSVEAAGDAGVVAAVEAASLPDLEAPDSAAGAAGYSTRAVWTGVAELGACCAWEFRVASPQHTTARAGTAFHKYFVIQPLTFAQEFRIWELSKPWSSDKETGISYPAPQAYRSSRDSGPGGSSRTNEKAWLSAEFQFAWLPGNRMLSVDGIHSYEGPSTMISLDTK